MSLKLKIDHQKPSLLNIKDKERSLKACFSDRLSLSGLSAGNNNRLSTCEDSAAQDEPFNLSSHLASSGVDFSALIGRRTSISKTIENQIQGQRATSQIIQHDNDDDEFDDHVSDINDRGSELDEGNSLNVYPSLTIKNNNVKGFKSSDEDISQSRQNTFSASGARKHSGIKIILTTDEEGDEDDMALAAAQGNVGPFAPELQIIEVSSESLKQLLLEEEKGEVENDNEEDVKCDEEDD